MYSLLRDKTVKRHLDPGEWYTVEISLLFRGALEYKDRSYQNSFLDDIQFCIFLSVFLWFNWKKMYGCPSLQCCACTFSDWYGNLLGFLGRCPASIGPMSSFLWEAIKKKKCHKVVAENNGTVFAPSSRDQNSEIEVSAGPCSPQSGWKNPVFASPNFWWSHHSNLSLVVILPIPLLSVSNHPLSPFLKDTCDCI